MTKARQEYISHIVDEVAFGRQLLKESNNSLSKAVLDKFKHSDLVIKDAFGAIADAFKIPYKELKSILKNFSRDFNTRAFDLYLEDCVDFADKLTKSE